MSKSSRTCAAYLRLGPHAVRLIPEVMLRDPARDKEVPLRIYHPAEPGRYPVILFSHGAGDSNHSSPHLMRHWASHGHVVILPTHLFGARPLIERSVVRLAQELMRPREMGPAAWRERTGDLVSIMDNFEAIERGAPGLAGRCDRDCVAVAGHSFGGYTVSLLGGATLRDPNTNEVFCFEDPRPQAVVVISGPGPDDIGLTERSWDHFHRPLMVFAGSRDPGHLGDYSGMWRAKAFELCPRGDKYLVYIRGAHHMSYIGPIFDLPMRDPARRGPVAATFRRCARAVARVFPGMDQAGIFDYTRIATTAFWDAYLRGDTAAKEFLCSRALEAYSERRVRLSVR